VNKERTTYLLMAATALLWGAGFVASKVVAENLPVFTSLVLRFTFGLAILGPMAWFTERGGFIPPRERLPALAFLGLSGLAANNGFLLLGLKTAPASVGSLIVGANPMAIALLAHLFLKERLVFRQWLGIPISFTGVLLVLWHGARELGAVGWRNLFFLASVLSWAVYSVAGRRVMRDISPLIATLWATFFGLLWCLPFVPLEGGPGLALIPLEAWLGVAYLGLLSSGLCFLMWYNSINLIGASRTGIFINIVPIAALFSSWLILGEQLTLMHLLGAALVIIGVTVTNYPEGGIRRARKEGGL
jgi:drug/metabolite transporter (DMT)-like permease